MASSQQTYPLRVGKSIRRANHRSSVSLRFQYIPPHVDLAGPGMLRRTADTCQVHLRTTDGKAMAFNGNRPSRSNPKLNDYVLVLVDGVMWLERNTDMFTGFRAGGVATDVDMEHANEDQDGDPDSWMADEGDSSPITPEAEDAEDHQGARKTIASKTVASKTIASKTVASKTVASKTISSKTVASKTVASKTVAGKSLHERKIVETTEVSCEDVEVEEASSEEDSDSDSEDSDSDSSSQGSQDYTDRSSDEEEYA